MKPSPAESNTMTGRTRNVWQPRNRRNLTDEDARQIAENVTGFFTILAEWPRAATPAQENPSDVPAASNTTEVCHER